MLQVASFHYNSRNATTGMVMGVSSYGTVVTLIDDYLIDLILAKPHARARGALEKHIGAGGSGVRGRFRRVCMVCMASHAHTNMITYETYNALRSREVCIVTTIQSAT